MYAGNIIGLEKMTKAQLENLDTYLFELRKGVFINAEKAGNWTRFINCPLSGTDPNCVCVVGGHPDNPDEIVLLIYSHCAIRAGAQLTISYGGSFWVNRVKR